MDLLQSWGRAEKAPWPGPDQATIPNRLATKAALGSCRDRPSSAPACRRATWWRTAPSVTPRSRAMWLLLAPRAAKVLMVMRASGLSRFILASAPRNGAVRGSQPETTARKSGRRLTRRVRYRPSACARLPDLRAGSGREWVACPSPACPGPARRPACDGARTAPFGYSRRLALVAGHPVNLIDLHLTLQPGCWDFGHEATAQMFRHRLHVGRAQAQLQGDLPVREVQAHEGEAQHPHPQRLMVSGQRRAGEVVKAPGAGLTAIALPMRLRVVAPVPDNREAVTPRTTHAIGPAMLAHQGEALGVVQKSREVDPIGCSHDDGGSSRKPDGCLCSSYHTRCPAGTLSKPTTPEADKSLGL